MENTRIPQPETILYTGRTQTVGGRDGGTSKSSDGQLNIKFASPGSNKEGTNPEQLFAAGWSACFIGAMGIAAAKMKLRLPAGTMVNTEVDLGVTEGEYSLQARLSVSLPGIDAETAAEITRQAHQTCPYSKATRGNINVEINLL